jgi:hypothetical protein
MNADELRELEERVLQVREMSGTLAWEMLRDRALIRIVSSQRRLIGGRVPNYEEYLKETSFLEGIEFVLTIPQLIQAELDLELEAREQAAAFEEEIDEELGIPSP